MIKKISIIANGSLNNKTFHKKLLNESNKIICADGGGEHAKELDIIPDYIIGDLDSVSKSTISYFKVLGKTKIIENKDQDKTDLELAILLAETLDPNEINILGAIGNRIDHTLANIYCLNKIRSDIKAQIIDDKNIIELVEKPIDVKGDKGDIVSIIPLTDISGLSYNGMKWLVSDKDTEFGWFGISNRLTNKKGNISFSKGKILVMRVRE
ncbi:MAG: thiamine diphosphokinase [Thermoplasmata archaeon]|nr:MAG: thiamine diphosphokinase [Thermoplasmata archaeon]